MHGINLPAFIFGGIAMQNMQTASMTTGAATLADAAWPAGLGAAWVRTAILAVVGSAFLALCAKIQLPMIPVPMTMQTFGVLMIGAAFGSRLGAGTVLLYLAEGLWGLPVFACANAAAVCAGPAYFAGTTGGYLIGFGVAAGIVGWLCERYGWDRKPVHAAFAMLAGNAIIYAFGLAWLYSLLVVIRDLAGWGVMRVLSAGLTPFLYGDLVKLTLAAVLLPLAWTLVRRFRGQ